MCHSEPALEALQYFTFQEEPEDQGSVCQAPSECQGTVGSRIQPTVAGCFGNGHSIAEVRRSRCHHHQGEHFRRIHPQRSSPEPAAERAPEAPLAAANGGQVSLTSLFHLNDKDTRAADAEPAPEASGVRAKVEDRIRREAVRRRTSQAPKKVRTWTGQWIMLFVDRCDLHICTSLV